MSLPSTDELPRITADEFVAILREGMPSALAMGFDVVALARGVVAYPEAVNGRLLESPPVSRVREIRRRGLKGGLARTSAVRREGK